MPLPVRKPMCKQDLDTTQVSIIESAEIQLHVPQNISKGIPSHLLEKKRLGDFILLYIQEDLALENVIWFMLLRKVRFQDSFINAKSRGVMLFISKEHHPWHNLPTLLLRSCFYSYIGDQEIGA